MNSKQSNVLMNKYRPLYFIGSGTFSEIICVENIYTKNKYAMKFENKNNTYSLLAREASIYKRLSGIRGVPQLLWFGSDAIRRYMIIPIYSYNLLQYKVTSINELIMIGNQLLGTLKQLHDKGYIHRDIKPENIMFNDPRYLHFIDFGICTNIYKFVETTVGGNISKVHIPQKKISNIIGTLNYVSTNIHEYITPSRRDDIISVVYVLLFLFWEGNLPWNISTQEDMKIQKEQLLILDGYDIVLSFESGTFDMTAKTRAGKIPEPIYKLLKKASELSYDDIDLSCYFI